MDIQLAEQSLAMLQAEILMRLDEIDLNNSVVEVEPLTMPGIAWEGGAGAEIRAYETDVKLGYTPFVAEPGTPFISNDLLSGILAELRMMLPSIRIFVAPSFKQPYVHNGNPKLNMSRKIHWDEGRKGYFLPSPVLISRNSGAIFLSTEYHYEEFIRAAYRGVWDMLAYAMPPKWFAVAEVGARTQENPGAEMGRMQSAYQTGFNPTKLEGSFFDYEMDLYGIDDIPSGFMGCSDAEIVAERKRLLEEAKNRLDGEASLKWDNQRIRSQDVANMIGWAGASFANYAMNLRLQHVTAYVYFDEDTEEVIYPRFANVYHAILRGEGDEWLYQHRVAERYIRPNLDREAA